MIPPPTSTGTSEDGAGDAAAAEGLGDGVALDIPAICCAVGYWPAAVEINGFTSGYVVGSTFIM